MGDLSITSYCQCLKTLSDLLANIDVIISKKSLVTYMVNGLPQKFEQIGTIIRHHNPFPSFLQARSMLLLEEQCLSKTCKHQASHTDHSSSPSILYTAAPTPQPIHSATQSSNCTSGRRNNGHHGRNNIPSVDDSTIVSALGPVLDTLYMEPILLGSKLARCTSCCPSLARPPWCMANSYYSALPRAWAARPSPTSISPAGSLGLCSSAMDLVHTCPCRSAHCLCCAHYFPSTGLSNPGPSGSRHCRMVHGYERLHSFDI